MAQITIKLTCKILWWVQPYIWLATVVAWTVAPFASDEQIKDWSEAHAAFIVKHGLRTSLK
jgi:hypothetical protein